MGSVSNPLALVVLAFLIERPMHPYELGKLLKQRNKQESIKYRHASLYMVVEQLSRKGFIEAQQTVRQGQLPERTVYALTESGQVEVLEQMRELVAVPAKEYLRFEAALALILVLPPAEVVDLLEQRQRALAEQAERLRSHVRDRQEMDQLFLIEHEYQLALVEAEQKFVQRFRERILQGAENFGEFWRRLHS